MNEKEIDEDLKFSDFLVAIRRIQKSILDNYLILLLLAILGGLIGAYIQYKSPKYYNATIYYSIDQPSGGNNAGGIGGLLGQITGGSAPSISAQRINAFVRSSTYGQSVLLDSVFVDGRQREIFSVIKELKPSFWKSLPKDHNHNIKTKNTELEQIRRKVFGKIEDRKRLNTTFIVSNFDEDLGIFTLSVEFPEEYTALEILNVAFEKLQSLYLKVEQASEIKNLAILEAKVDSINQLLATTEIKLARKKDASRGLKKQIDLLQIRRLENQVTKLNYASSEIITQFETRRIIHLTTRPSFTIIDRPTTPLKVIKGNWIKGMIQGILVGTIITFTFIALIAAYKKAQHELGEVYE